MWQSAGNGLPDHQGRDDRKESGMGTPLSQLADLVGGKLRGESVEINGAATLAIAQVGEITLADSVERASQLEESQAAAAVVSAEVDWKGIPTILVDDVHEAFAKIVTHFRPRPQRQLPGISTQASISPSAKLAADVQVHPQAVIADEVTIGTGTVIHSGVTIMPGCVIGAGVTLFPNVVLYEQTQVGDKTTIHAGSILGAYGFGYEQKEGRHKLSAQLGYVVVEAEVEIGACVTIDRGTYGPTIIGEGTKIDNLVQIAHNCRLGKHNLICSQVGIAGSTSTGDYVVMAGQVGVRDNVHIGQGAVLCSKAGVPNDVPAGEMVLGSPAAPLRQQKLQMAAISKLPDMRREFRSLQRQVAQLVEAAEGACDSETDEKAA